jgi:phage baseplate assembly protein W
MAYNTNLVTNKDFDLKMTKVPNGLSNGGDIVMKIDRPNLNRFPSIEQSISNILLTSKKERRFDRLFGGSLYESLFDLSTDFNNTNKFSSARAINIRQSIIIALKNYEPRIRVLNVSLGEDKNQRNASIDRNELNVTIEYTIPPVEETITYTLGIKRVK